MGRVEVAIVNSTGPYMASNGTFSTGERWISAFLNSPGSPGSNYSYTTPIHRGGAYKVRVRPVDHYGQYPVYREVNVTVSAPAGNTAPVAVASVTLRPERLLVRRSRQHRRERRDGDLLVGLRQRPHRHRLLPDVTYTSPGTFTRP